MLMRAKSWLAKLSCTVIEKRTVAVGCLQNGDDFSFFLSLKRTIRNKSIIEFLRRLKEGHSRFVDVEISKQLKKGRAQVTLRWLEV